MATALVLDTLKCYRHGTYFSQKLVEGLISHLNVVMGLPMALR